MAELSDLLKEAESVGWSSSTASFDTLTQQARWASYNPVPNREGGPIVSILEPTSTADAHERSLSAIVGFGPQPLHTDGAHHPVPPDFIILSSTAPSTVPTYLWNFRSNVTSAPISDLYNGLFTVRSGKAAFLAPASQAGKLRYDPGCMTPADPRAVRTAEYLDAQIANATEFSWSTDNLVLVIANRYVLHARGDATNESDRALRRLSLIANEQADGRRSSAVSWRRS